MLTSDEVPDVPVESAELLHRFQKCLGVLDGGVDLQAIADDAWIRKQALPLLLTVLRDDLGDESVEGLAVIFPLV